jgi:hypothetical protein
MKRGYSDAFGVCLEKSKNFKGEPTVLPSLSEVVACALQDTRFNVSSFLPQTSSLILRDLPAEEVTVAPISDESSSSSVSDAEDDESDADSPTSPQSSQFVRVVDNPHFDFHQQNAIRTLAFQVGLSRDPNKLWRYRDIKRCLFRRITKEQLEYIDNDFDHKLLVTRLPHKLSLIEFCKRVMLIVYHYIVRDGKEPKFYQRREVNTTLIGKILESEPAFAEKVNVKKAKYVFALVNTGLSLTDAVKKADTINY